MLYSSFIAALLFYLGNLFHIVSLGYYNSLWLSIQGRLWGITSNKILIWIAFSFLKGQGNYTLYSLRSM